MCSNRRLVICTTLVTLVAVAAFAAKIKSNHDKSADFNSYRTFAWGLNVEPQRPAAAIFLRGAINHELGVRGLQQSEDIEKADLIVRYQAGGDKDISFAGTDPTYAAIGGIPWSGSSVWTAGFSVPSTGRFVRKGTLIIDVFDQRQHKLIWTSSATDTVHDSPKKAIEQVNKIIEKMFLEYPTKGVEGSGSAR